MEQGDELKILIEAALDLEKSLQNIVADMRKLQERMKTYQIKVLAGLDKSASGTQIKSDLAQITRTKSKVKIVGEVDKSATRKNVNTAIKNLKNAEIQLTGVLDATSTQKNVQKQLGQIPKVEATANVNVSGGDEVDKLRQRMDNVGGSAENMASRLYLARTALQALRRTTHEAIDTMRELDSAVTDLSMATGQDREKTYELLQDYNKLAEQLGSTTGQVAQAADQWLRQGHSISDTSTLIEDAMILSKVSQLDSAAATEYLTASMKGYKVAAQDVIDIVDKLSAVDLESATDAGGLAEAMSRTAVTADMAGVSMNRLLGYLATVGEVTQKSMSSVGESFKTIFTRMSDIKANKLELIDEDGTTEMLSDVETTLKNVGIDLRKTVNEYNNYGDVLDNLAVKWNTLTNVQQNALTKAFAGTRQGENFRVLMENYSTAIKYMGIAEDSAGTAMEKFSTYTDSVEAKINTFTAAIENLTLDTVDSGFVGDLIDAGTAIIDLVEKTDLLKAALVSLGAGAVLKGVSAISAEFLAAKQNILNLGEAVKTLRNVQNAGALSAETITRLGGLIKGLTDEQLRLVLSTQQLTTAQMTQILTTGGLTEAEAAAKLQTLGLATAEGTATAATFTLSGAMTGLGTAIKAAFATNPVGMIMLAVGAAYELVKGIMAIYDAVTVTAEEATEAMEESVSEFEDASNKVENLNNELQTTQERIDELEAKDSLTFIEESELQKLRESVELMQIQADLAEKERKSKAKDAADDTVVAYQKNFRHDISADAVQEYMDYSNTSGNNAALFADENNISAMLAGIEQMERLRDELDKSSEYYQEDYQHFQGIIDDATDSIWEQIGVLGTYKSNLEAIPYDELTDDQKAALDEINAAIEFVYKALDPAKWNEIQWGNIVSDEKYSGDVKKLNELAGQSEITADTIKEQFPALAQACSDAGIAVEDVAENINASFERVEGDGVAEYTAQLSNLSNVISGLKSSYDLLETAQKDMADGGGLSPETIAKLADAEANYLDYIYEENGVVKLNIEAWKKRANAKMLGEMDEIQKEIDSLNEENAALEDLIATYEEKRLAALQSQDLTAYYDYYHEIDNLNAKIQENNAAIEANQGKLAIYSSLYGSITGDLDVYTSALNNFSNVASAIDSISSSFQTLADLQATVANGFTMSLDKALEFAKVYPEIMNSAQVAANGQITLNKDVVNFFIEGKKAELDAQIDSQIAQLEADKAVLNAKLASAQAQLELAKNVGEGEGQISKETAEYRINVGNALTSALIDMGVDEATAFQLAAAVMAEDEEEFARVAKGCFENMDDNAAKAAYNMAHAIFVNADKSCDSIADIAAQAHQTAKAISAMGNGDVAGSAVSQFGGSDGTNVGGLSLDLYHGEFKGTEYDYDAKTLGLDDYVSQLELDISAYQDAITQIDGQIAALQALKNAPLKSFESKSGSGSGGSKKEVEEYIADIDEYREAVERLRKAQAEVERITTDIDNAGSIEKKIALEKELISAYQEEQAALHNLNNLRDGTVTAGVKTLQDLGFAVKYNADTNELWVENLEHLNELTADSKGQYGSLQEATNALRKDTEELINTITDLNEANREGSTTWWEVQRAILDAQIAVCEFEAQLHNNVLTLTENWLDNAINQKNSDDVKRYTTEMIANYKALQEVYHKQAEALRAAGYSDTTDEIVKLSDAWWDLVDKIKDAQDKVVDYFVELVDAANDAVDSIQNVSDVLSDAAQEFADNDGWISVDTYQAIIALGAEYMQMLINENNELVINRDRINGIIEAKTRQLAVEQALSYVERLRLAATGASNESLDQLCFATTQATNSTWGLVYAELALMQQTGLLNGSQYQAALHNIQAIQSLAETAVAGIGQTAGAAAEKMDHLKEQLEDQKDALEDLLDELEDMKDGCDDLVKYVMDMLKDRIQQQIDALNDAKKAVKDYVDQLKEAMRAEKENIKYEDELADKLKAIAKLQSKIDALSLDDSRKAQAEKMALEEELAELQKDLADFQADHAMDVTEDALDKQYEAYEQEKDAEIEKLEESISSTQKLYDMAIKYIKENWNTLYQELLDWNYEYGNSLNSEITAAWEAAQEAASRYGDFVTAIMGGIESEIAKITAQIQSLTTQISNLSNSTSGASGNGIGGSTPNVVGTVSTDTLYSDEDMKQAKRKAVSDVVSQMRALSAQWHTADKATKKRLEDQALQLGATLASYGIVAHRDDPTGAWYIDNDLLNPSNAGKLLYSCYHTGGFVGDEPLKPNERYVKAENGELILTSEQQDSFAAQVDSFRDMADAFDRSVMAMPVNTDSLWPKGFAEGSSSTSNVSTDNSRTININEGDIHVSVPAGDGRIIADEVRKITRENVNQISRMLMRP